MQQMCPCCLQELENSLVPLGFASLFLRGMGLREFRQSRRQRLGTRGAPLDSDGPHTRVRGAREDVRLYLRSGFFWVKYGLFLLVFALEIQPMVTFIRWRIAKERAAELVGSAPLDRLISLNDAETILVLVIPFAAALMARGAWMF
jgi:hypothetical protein